MSLMSNLFFHWVWNLIGCWKNHWLMVNLVTCPCLIPHSLVGHWGVNISAPLQSSTHICNGFNNTIISNLFNKQHIHWYYANTTRSTSFTRSRGYCKCIFWRITNFLWEYIWIGNGLPLCTIFKKFMHMFWRWRFQNGG